MLRFPWKLLLIFFIKRPYFVRSNSVCYSFHGEEINDNAATFIYEPLYALQKVKAVSFKPSSLFELLLLISGDIKICPGPSPREISELDALLKAKVLHLFRQNMWGLLCNKDYLVELIDSFKKVQTFALADIHVNKDLDYGSLFEIPGFSFVSKPR